MQVLLRKVQEEAGGVRLAKGVRRGGGECILSVVWVCACVNVNKPDGIVYTVQCTLSSVHYPVYTIQCTLLSY